MLRIPTPEIIEKAKKLNYFVEHFLDPGDPESDEKMNAWLDIQDKYDFWDQIFEENGHYGIKDVEGKVIVPALYYDYEEIPDFFSDRDKPIGAINDERKVALIKADGTGTPLCDFIYDHVGQVSGTPYFYTVFRHKFGLITSRGEELLPCIYDRIEDPINGIFPLRKDNKFGFFCEYGQGFTVPCLYDDLDEEEGTGLVLAQLGKTQGYFDATGKFIPKEEVANSPQNDLLKFI